MKEIMNIFEAKKLQFRRKVLVLAGAKIDVTNLETGEDVGFVKMKAFKLKEDIKLYKDTTRTELLLNIQARSVIDFGATYDVLNDDGSIRFSLRRKGLRSAFVRDTWLLLNADGSEFGQVSETGDYALFRRYISFIPLLGDILDLILFFMTIEYKVFIGADAQQQVHVASIYRQKNPIVVKYATNMDAGEGTADSQVVVAATTLLSVIELGKN
jgi:hypothetical protein